MGPIDLSGAFYGLLLLGALIIAGTWGMWELIDWLFIDDAIRVSEPLVPELELTVKDNIIDTVYVYRKP